MQMEIEHLSKKFGSVTAVEDVNLDIHDGEFVAFLGPSGCGKTTTLLMLAGIYKPTDGRMRFGQRIVNQVPPRDRNIGMVFQSYALYPHMTVMSNIAYPLKLQRVPKKEQQERVQQIADMMGIGHLLDRKPGQLSGGQQQRVALGRALVKQPDVLLFDEPLSNLDARLRLTMRGEIKHLQKSLGITSVYVTHDQVEALTMADRIAVMNNAKLEAFDTPENLYERPRTLFIAGFVGNPPMNFIDVNITQEGDTLVAQNHAFSLPIPSERAELKRQTGEKTILGIRPEDITVHEDGTIKGEVYVVEPLGRDDMLDVRVGESRLVALTDPKLRIKSGDIVALNVNTAKLHFFDPSTERSLLWN
jgi:ABC-type sugar transport system ATPase subunit